MRGSTMWGSFTAFRSMATGCRGYMGVWIGVELFYGFACDVGQRHGLPLDDHGLQCRAVPCRGYVGIWVFGLVWGCVMGLFCLCCVSFVPFG